MENTKFDKELREFEANTAKKINITEYTPKQLRQIRNAQVLAKAKQVPVIMLMVDVIGHETNKEYKEKVYIKTEDFEKYIYNKTDIVDIRMLSENEQPSIIEIPELNGRYKNVKAEIHVRYITDNIIAYETDSIQTYFNDNWSGSLLSQELFNNDTEIEDSCINNLEDYINKLDPVITVTAKIKSSQKAAFDYFIKTLHEQ